jgi:SPP1 gp7 family putative phage head morphogenesis protein
MGDMRRLTDEVTRLVERFLIPVLEEGENTYAPEEFRDADFRVELAAAFAEIERILSGQSRSLETYATGIATKAISQWNRAHRKQWVKEINRIAGVDIGDVLNDQTIKAALLDKVDENVKLIKTLPKDYYADVKKKVLQGVNRGDDFFSIREDLEKIESFNSRYRPELIARDQMSKLTGELNKLRQEDLGITHYTWRTSKDSRVRDSHRKNDGKEFSWASAPAGTGHPGEDILCRCIAEPVFDGFLGQMQQRRTWTPDDPRVMERHPAFTKSGKLRKGFSRTTGERVTKKPRFRPATRPEKRPVIKKRNGEPIALSPAQQDFDQVARYVKNDIGKFGILSKDERKKVLQWNWVHGSNRKVSVGMKEALKKEFNLNGVVYNPRGFKIPDEHINSIRSDLRAIYNSTQKDFQRRGIERVRLYRGVKTDVVGSGVMESWTADPNVARRFGGKVMVKDVPVNKVLSHRGSPDWVDGIWGDQKEYIVME